MEMDERLESGLVDLLGKQVLENIILKISCGINADIALHFDTNKVLNKESYFKILEKHVGKHKGLEE